MMTVFVVYTVMESNVEIKGVFKSKETSENDAYTITLPPANTVETGTSLLFNNVGQKDFTLLYNDGTPLTNVIIPGEVIPDIS